MLRRIEVNSANRSLPGRYKILLAAILLSVLIFAAWQPMKNDSTSTESTDSSTDAGLNVDPVATTDPTSIETDPTSTDSSDLSSDLTKTPTDELANDIVNEYIISSGDTLAKVLESHEIGFKEVFLLTKKYPSLEKDLRPGQLISWTTNDDGHLQNLTWTISRKETRIYELSEEDGFIETIELTKGEWREIVINGEIGQDGNATLCGSAIAAGLTSRECHNAARYLQYQVNLNALRLGDKFSVLVEREFVNEEHSASRLLAARMTHRKRDRYIVYFEKYRAYYDEEGKPLTDGFLRIPTSSDKQYRISSHFNPRRLHPVTKKIAPHNGTDFAMPIGTPLVAAGDGEVVIARFSPTAGNYVAIRHGKQYSTRYLHMNKITVRPGQIVKRGDLIGYSGNTGRSTGPHLHYEFLDDNKPVDPMKMTLPRQEGLKNADLKEFLVYGEGVKAKFTQSLNTPKPEAPVVAETPATEAATTESAGTETPAAETAPAAGQAVEGQQTSTAATESEVKVESETAPETGVKAEAEAAPEATLDTNSKAETETQSAPAAAESSAS